MGRDLRAVPPVKEIPLYGKVAVGRVALVDDEDYELVMQYRWNAWQDDGRTYAMSGSRRSGETDNITMHRLLTRVLGGASPGVQAGDSRLPLNPACAGSRRRPG